MKFILIEGSCYKMGDNFGDGDGDERPVHEVCVDDYYIGKYEVTQGQWKKIMGENPSYYKKGDEYPVECVSWNDAQEFITKLNKKTDQNYRLPTEAEWEYAARSGGKREKFAGFSYENDMCHYANFCDVNCGYYWKTETQDDGYENISPVGSYRPNGLGLYDMSGNVWEWCSDWYDWDYYKNSPRNNPIGPSSGSSGSLSFRVLRGGSWYNLPSFLRASNRYSSHPDRRSHYIGFRLARTP